MSKEGIPTIVSFTVFTLILALTGYIYQNTLLIFISVLFLIITGLVTFFFRDPQRTPTADPLAILSPADGVVLDISEVNEPLYLEARVTRIAIYMSLFNVHVNYIPFSGKVDYLTYVRGKYFRANTVEASRHNVYSFVGLETSHGKMAFKQMTGMMTRRIVCRLKLDQQVKAGEKFGIIKFGSRMEVFLPPTAKIAVKTGDRLLAAESVIGFIDEKQ